ncbi:MAG TPA: hypothetical protein VI685_03600 [Candidatus Angelobacter sp.]
MLGNPKQIAKKEPGLENAAEILRSGEIAQHSGLYELQHDSHAVEKEVFLRKGTTLPACQDCGKPLTFILVRKVEHIEDDPDFQ